MAIQRVLIVGAGIAGLALARALARHGLPFDLIEKTPQPAPLGAGIMLVFNSLRLLDALGVGEQLRERGTPFDGALIASVNGTALQNASLSRVLPGAQSLGLHRADLHDVLSEGLPVQWGTALTAVYQGADGVDVTLSGSQERHYALIIGADGLHSTVRQRVFSHVPARYVGYTCWRFVTPLDFSRDPVEWWGKGRRLGLAGIGRGRTYGYATLNCPAGTPDPAAGRAARLQTHFQEFPTLARTVLAHVQDQEVLHHDLFEFPRHHWQRGRVALIGDAAHAMTPNMGQGAGMGIEDAVTLAQALHVHGLSRVALKAYRDVRQHRVKAMAGASRLIGWAGQLEHPLLRTVRDTTMSMLPEPFADQQLYQRLFTTAPSPPRY